MQRILTSLAVCLFAAIAAQAQNPQPVKEMEKAARSAVNVTCNTSIPGGLQADFGDCTIRAGAVNHGTVVPTGKTLVIEDISANCVKSNTEIWNGFYLTGGGVYKNIPLQLVGVSPNNRQNWIGSLPTRQYVNAGDSIQLYTRTQERADNPIQCQVRLQGHLVSAQ